MVATAAQEVQCPCCDNPWARATGDWFAKLCQECDETTMDRGVGLSRSNMDFDVHPRDDFYLYANGSWLKNNPIPSGYPNWNSFLTLHVQSQENLKQILEDLASKDTSEEGGGTITDEERKSRREKVEAAKADLKEKVQSRVQAIESRNIAKTKVTERNAASPILV